ncbi:MAG: SUMF1/EgtB/PvdOfamily nonheme iron enzyme [Bacteroidetes bacterium]|nr:SUMF1/EgtB/PvdOfamily nonheme iron enzyme [Bacteroidota bacterium]
MNSREFKERYVFDPQHDLIAEGTYSRVFRAVDSLLQRDICIKYFRKELITGSSLIKELNRAGIFFHPNICAFYDLVEIEETNVLGEIDAQPIGVVEYVNGGMLTDYVQKHGSDDETIKRLIKDVIKGLSYLHSLGRPHLDIKPGNLLVKLTEKDPIAKISDFLNNENINALSVPSTVKPQQLCYKAPEYFEGAYGELSVKADIWALGLVVFELISGEKLFYKEGDTVEKVMRNICHSDHWVRVHNLPEPFVNFVKKCLVRNVQERNVSLEELTLILDGYKSEEAKSQIAASGAIYIDPVISPEIKTEEVAEPSQQEREVTMMPPVEVPEPTAIVPPVVNQEPSAPKAENKPVGKKKQMGLSIPVIIGALIILGGISAFIWTIVDDKDHASRKQQIAMAGNMPIASASAPASASEVHTEQAAPQVIHDTIRVVQIQQKYMPAPYAPVAKNMAPADKPGSTTNAKGRAMPVLPSFDYLYADKPYYFDLKTPLLSDEEFEMYSDNAAITTLGKNTFYVKPTKTGPLAMVVVEKGTHNKLAEKEYNVKVKPRPVPTIGDDIVGGFVSPKMLLAKLTISGKSENGSYSKVKSFKMTCKSGSCDINDVSSDGTFNESMIRFLHNVKPGEKLFFENIIAEGENGQPMRLDDFQLTTY